MAMTIAIIVSWSCVIFVFFCAISVYRSRRRVKQFEASIMAGWLDEAPRLPPVEIVMRSGETLFAEATLIDRVWLYEIDPPPPDLVHEIIFEAPMHCSIVPKVHR